MLDMSPRVLEKVLYFASYIVIDPKETNLTAKQILSEREYRDAVDAYGKKAFVAKMGAEAIRMILQAIDIDKMAAELREEFRSSTGQKRVRIIQSEIVLSSESKNPVSLRGGWDFPLQIQVCRKGDALLVRHLNLHNPAQGRVLEQSVVP